MAYLHKKLYMLVCVNIRMILNSADSMLLILHSHPLPVHMLLDIICYFNICRGILEDNQGK